MRYISHKLFIAIIVLAMPSFTLAQTLNAKAKAPHVETAPAKISTIEDVFFNAQAREVFAQSSLNASQVSATSIGSDLSLLFDSARVSLQAESDPMVATWVGTVTVPVNMSAKSKPKSYLQHIRGSLNKTADTRVTIFLELGGKGFVAEFPYGMKSSGDITRRFLSSIKPAASARYTASMVIFAERRNAKSTLLVDIDSLDVTAR